MDADFLVQLRSAAGGQTQDWLVMQQGLKNLSHSAQRAVWAAAIPHWFDVAFLEALLRETDELTAADFETLTHLSFVEPFPEYGLNIHEHSRHIILKELWQRERKEFIELSQRAQVYCSAQKLDEPTWRIELIYHGLTANHEEGLRLFADQVNEWREKQLYDKVEILVRTALEVAEAGRLPNWVTEKIDTANAGVKLVYGADRLKEAQRGGDPDLVRRFLAGDADAVRTIDGWSSRASWPYRRRLAHRWDDVMQDVRLEIVRLLSQGRWKGESSLRTYLWRVVNHACLGHIKADSRSRDLDNVEDPNSVVRRYVDQETAEVTSQQEDRDLLVRVLEKVSEDCREFWRMVIAGLSYKDISVRMGVAEGTLRVRALRCREKALALRAELLSSQVSSKVTQLGGATKGQDVSDERNGA